MNYKDLFEKWGLTQIKLNIGFAEAKFEPQTEDQDAAWELYVDLITRVTTQSLEVQFGDEKTALQSVYDLFPITREILKRKGKKCINFTKIAVIVLNQVIRPFTTKWHNEDFKESQKCEEFRIELEFIRHGLMNYSRMLADIAEVEDLTADVD